MIAEELGDSKPLVLTWNNTSLYTWGFLDLKKDGPTVVELPPGVLGVFNDMYFRYITDMGAAGVRKLAVAALHLSCLWRVLCRRRADLLGHGELGK